VQPPDIYDLVSLAALTETPRRTVRYYIQCGLVDHPEGIGKGASYSRRHVQQLLLIRKWQLAGLSLERIRELLKAPERGPLPPAPRRPGTVEVWSHLVVADGLEVTVERGRAGLSPEQVREFFRAVGEAYARIHESEEKE